MIKFKITGKKNINSAIKQLKDYKKELIAKSKEFCEKLGNKGIKVAQVNSGEYGSYIRFELVPQNNGNRVSFVFVASSISQVNVTWDSGSYDIDPLLMAEFGSGWLAINKWGLDGVGQGTHPQQTHAKDPKGWFYSENGVSYHSVGHLPTFPVHLAWLEMVNTIDSVVKEVFG